MAATGEPGGVLVVRVWFETDATPPMRARITASVDDAEPREIAVAATAADVLATVSFWLRALAAGG